jgi:hypothetical protein
MPPEEMNKAVTRFLKITLVVALLAAGVSVVFLRTDRPVSNPPPPSDTSNAIIVVASMVTAGAAALGLFINSAIGWRKDKRESESAALDDELKRLELEERRRRLDKRKR